MSLLNIYGHTSSNTMISNAFIDDYMKDANDAQIKVYLYLNRCVSAGMSVSVSDIADKFNHTERDVIRALKFWEQSGVMTLEYDSDHNLVGISFLDLMRRSSVDASAQDAFAVSAQPTQGSCAAPTSSACVAPTRKTSRAHREVAASNMSENIRKIPVPVVPAKPAYTIDELKAFKSRPEIQELLFITEQYLAKPLTPTDVRSIMYISDGLHFDTALADYLVQYCVENNKRDLRHIEKTAVSWAEANIRSVEEAQKYARGCDDDIQTICTALGRTTAPSLAESEFYRRWTNEFAFSQEIILEACKRACLATDKHRFEYTNGILKNWSESGIKTLADIDQMEDAFKASRPTSATVAKKTKNSFNTFKQNDYDFSELERQLVSN